MDDVDTMKLVAANEATAFRLDSLHRDLAAAMQQADNTLVQLKSLDDTLKVGIHDACC